MPATNTALKEAYAAPVALSDAERSRLRVFALASADQTYDNLGPHLKRALGFERTSIDRQPRRVRQELHLALRKARKLVEQLEHAEANLPAES